MIRRYTIWHDEARNTLQASLAALSNDWEPMTEFTVKAQPFDSEPFLRAWLDQDLEDFLQAHGEQLRLSL